MMQGAQTRRSVTTWRGVMGWEAGGRFEREETYVYLRLSQYYKAMIF